MAVPDFQSLMLPVLKALADGGEVSVSEVRARLIITEKLTDKDAYEKFPSGHQPVLTNRVSWALKHMAEAGLHERVSRGVYRLTIDGGRLLAQSPPKIDLKLLRQYPLYREWADATNWTKPLSSNKKIASGQGITQTDTPDETLDKVIRQLRKTLQTDVLNWTRKARPAFLEQVVIDLLIAMGYGGGNASMGQVTGRAGDGGIDGTVREDALGLDEVYVQAKKYAEGNTVGESELRNFAGAIDAAGTTKGVFVTTSTFTKAAQDYIKLSPKRIVLIDGEELSRLMVEYNIGVRIKHRYEIKIIAEDYFDQESL